MSMCLVKRIVPFAAALTLGLFVASFFVTVAAPRFNFKRNYSSRKYREVRDLKNENLRLNEELRQSRKRVAELEIKRTMDFEEFPNESEIIPERPLVTTPRATR